MRKNKSKGKDTFPAFDQNSELLIAHNQTLMLNKLRKYFGKERSYRSTTVNPYSRADTLKLTHPKIERISQLVKMDKPTGRPGHKDEGTSGYICQREIVIELEDQKKIRLKETIPESKYDEKLLENICQLLGKKPKIVHNKAAFSVERRPIANNSSFTDVLVAVNQRELNELHRPPQPMSVQMASNGKKQKPKHGNESFRIQDMSVPDAYLGEDSVVVQNRNKTNIFSRKSTLKGTPQKLDSQPTQAGQPVRSKSKPQKWNLRTEGTLHSGMRNEMSKSSKTPLGTHEEMSKSFDRINKKDKFEDLEENSEHQPKFKTFQIQSSPIKDSNLSRNLVRENTISSQRSKATAKVKFAAAAPPPVESSEFREHDPRLEGVSCKEDDEVSSIRRSVLGDQSLNLSKSGLLSKMKIDLSGIHRKQQLRGAEDGQHAAMRARHSSMNEMKDVHVHLDKKVDQVSETPRRLVQVSGEVTAAKFCPPFEGLFRSVEFQVAKLQRAIDSLHVLKSVETWSLTQTKVLPSVSVSAEHMSLFLESHRVSEMPPRSHDVLHGKSAVSLRQTEADSHAGVGVSHPPHQSSQPRSFGGHSGKDASSYIQIVINPPSETDLDQLENQPTIVEQCADHHDASEKLSSEGISNEQPSNSVEDKSHQVENGPIIHDDASPSKPCTVTENQQDAHEFIQSIYLDVLDRKSNPETNPQEIVAFPAHFQPAEVERIQSNDHHTKSEEPKEPVEKYDPTLDDKAEGEEFVHQIFSACCDQYEDQQIELKVQLKLMLQSADAEVRDDYVTQLFSELLDHEKLNQLPAVMDPQAKPAEPEPLVQPTQAPMVKEQEPHPIIHNSEASMERNVKDFLQGITSSVVNKMEVSQSTTTINTNKAADEFVDNLLYKSLASMEGAEAVSELPKKLSIVQPVGILKKSRASTKEEGDLEARPAKQITFDKTNPIKRRDVDSEQCSDDNDDIQQLAGKKLKGIDQAAPGAVHKDRLSVLRQKAKVPDPRASLPANSKPLKSKLEVQKVIIKLDSMDVSKKEIGDSDVSHSEKQGLPVQVNLLPGLSLSPNKLVVTPNTPNTPNESPNQSTSRLLTNSQTKSQATLTTKKRRQIYDSVGPSPFDKPCENDDKEANLSSHANIYTENINLYGSGLCSEDLSVLEPLSRPKEDYDHDHDQKSDSGFQMDYAKPKTIKGVDPSKQARGKKNADLTMNNLGFRKRGQVNQGDGNGPLNNNIMGAKKISRFPEGNDPFLPYKMTRVGDAPYDFIIQDYDEHEGGYSWLVMGFEEAASVWFEDSRKEITKNPTNPDSPFQVEEPVGLGIKPQNQRSSTPRKSEMKEETRTKKKAQSGLPLMRPKDEAPKKDPHSDSEDSASSQQKKAVPVLPAQLKAIKEAKAAAIKKKTDASEDESSVSHTNVTPNNKPSTSSKKKTSVSKESNSKQSKDHGSDDNEDNEASNEDESEESSAESESMVGSKPENISEMTDDDRDRIKNKEKKAAETRKAKPAISCMQVHFDDEAIVGLQAVYEMNGEFFLGKMMGSRSKTFATSDKLTLTDRTDSFLCQCDGKIVKCMKLLTTRGRSFTLGNDSYSDFERVYTYKVSRKMLGCVQAGFDVSGHLACIAFKLVASPQL